MSVYLNQVVLVGQLKSIDKNTLHLEISKDVVIPLDISDNLMDNIDDVKTIGIKGRITYINNDISIKVEKATYIAMHKKD